MRSRFAFVCLMATSLAMLGCGSLSVRYNDPSDPFSQCCRDGRMVHDGRLGCRTGAARAIPPVASESEDSDAAVPGAKFHSVPVQPVFERQP